MNDINAIKPPPLPVWEIIRDAFVITWQRKWQFTRVLILPILLLVLTEHISTSLLDRIGIWSPIDRIEIWLLTPLYFVITTLLAVACHRLVLIGDDAVPQTLGIPLWSWRETRFLGWCLLIGLYTVILFLLIAYFSSLYAWFPETILNSFKSLSYIPKLIASYIPMLILLYISYLVARWSLILPATAVDKRLTLSEAWDLAAGNGWRLAIVVCILPYGSSFLASFVIGIGGSTIADIFFSAFGYFLMVIEIAVLSLAYKFLNDYSMKQEATTVLF